MQRWECCGGWVDIQENIWSTKRESTVAPIFEKMIESHLWWFDHVGREPIESLVRRFDLMENSQINRGKGKEDQEKLEEKLLKQTKI